VIMTPFRSPQANAHAARLVRTAGTECPDWMLILGPRHLDRVLRIYVAHYNTQRPHRALGRCAPLATQPSAGDPAPNTRAKRPTRRAPARVPPRRSRMTRRNSVLAPFTRRRGRLARWLAAQANSPVTSVNPAGGVSDRRAEVARRRFQAPIAKSA
jgi:hypothetical protein